MKFKLLFIFIFVVVSSCFCQEIWHKHQEPEQMFKQWLNGVARKKLDDFKVGYSQNYWDSLSKKEQKSLLEKYKKSFTSYGIKCFKLKDFNIDFKGDVNEGKLIIVYKDKVLAPIKVEKNNDFWVFAEK